MLYLIYFILLFMFPIVLSILISFIIDKGKNGNLKDDLKYILGVLFEIVKIFTIIYLVIIVLYEVTPNENNIKIAFLNILYSSPAFPS